MTTSTDQIIGYVNGQFVYGTVETVHETGHVRIDRSGSAAYALYMDGAYVRTFTTEEEARQHAAQWDTPSTAMPLEKSIRYNRATRDYAMYLDSELVGFARNYHEAEVKLDQLVFELMTDGWTHTATELDGAQPEHAV